MPQPVPSIPVSIPTTLTQNVVYALPAGNVNVFVNPTTGVEVGSIFAGPFAAATPVNGSFVTPAAFIRCTAAGPTQIICAVH